MLFRSPLLVRTMLKYDRLKDAFAFALVAIQVRSPYFSSTLDEADWERKQSPTPAPESPAASSLPYALFDQLLALKPEETSALEPQVLKERQKELRDAVAARLGAVERADRNVARRAK